MADQDLMSGVTGGEPQPGIGGGLVSIGPEDAAAKQPEPTSKTEPSPSDGAGQDAAASDGTDGGTASKKGSFAERVRELAGKDIADLRQSIPTMIAQALREAGVAPREAAVAAAAPGMGGAAGVKFARDLEQHGVEVAMENYNKSMLGNIETRFDRMQATSWIHGQPEAKDPEFIAKWERWSARTAQQYPFLERLALSSPIEAANLAMTLFRADPANAVKTEPVLAAAARPTGNPAGIPKESVISPGTGAGTAGNNSAVWTPALFNQRILEAQGIQDHTQRREAMNQIDAEYDMAKATGHWKEA